MAAVYSVDSITTLKAIDPLSVSIPSGTRALFDGEKRSVINTGGFTPSWYTYRKVGGSPGWPTGVPSETLPVIVRPTTNSTDGAWVSDSLYKIFSTVKPSDTPPNLLKDVNKGIEWIATLTSGSTIRYVSDGTVWKPLFMSPVFSSTVNPPSITPDEIGQVYIFNDGTVKSAYIANGTSTSSDWLAL